MMVMDTLSFILGINRNAEALLLLKIKLCEYIHTYAEYTVIEQIDYNRGINYNLS
jgi:hypothetical protein